MYSFGEELSIITQLIRWQPVLYWSEKYYIRYNILWVGYSVYAIYGMSVIKHQYYLILMFMDILDFDNVQG